MMTMTPFRGINPEFYAWLPGPTRKRTRSRYRYRLTYRSPQPDEPGCALLWEVAGGRLPYQIALERGRRGELRWHCTCADAVYRGENAPHVCKHVRALQALGRPQPAPEPAPAPPPNCVGA
jgi:hypothetical protein